MALSGPRALPFVLLPLLTACAPGASEGPATTPRSVATACELCGRADGAHADYATWSATPGRRLLVTEPASSAATSSATAAHGLCPRAFGALPPEGKARIVRVDDAFDGSRRSVRWALVSARPWSRPLLEPLRARLGGIGEGGDRVWLLTCTVRAARAADGRPAGRVELQLESAGGGTLVTSGVAAWATTDLALDALAFGPVSRGDVELPATIELTKVDGNPIELVLGADAPQTPDAAADEADFLRLPWRGQVRELARKGQRAPTELFP